MFEKCDSFLNVFLAMSFSGTLWIVVLLAGKRFWQDKISRQWQYYIWLIVILRLLLPFAPEWNLMETARQTIGQVRSQTTTPVQSQSLINQSKDVDLVAVNTPQDIEKPDSPAQDNKKRTSPLQGKKMLKNLMTLLCSQVWLIWLAVVSGLLIRKITLYQSFVRYIRAGMTPVADIAMLERLSEIEKQAGVKRPVELCVNPFVSTPMFMGFFHPCIVLPSAKLPEKDFYYIVLHELMHYKRRELLYKWLVELTVCLHWFNPAVYLMRREITKACEFSCDAAVLAKVGKSHATDYGKTLLDAMAAVRKYRETVGAVPLSENKQLLKERLGAVMRYQKKSSAEVLMTSALTLVIVLSAALVGVYPAAAAETSVRQEEDTFAAQIKQYYEEGSLPLFQIAFSQLDETAKMVWLERIYTDGQIPFLGGAVNELEIDSAAVSHYAEKAYADDSVSIFSIMAKRMSEKTLRTWLDRALADGQYAFQSVLFGLLDDERLDALEEEADRQFDTAQRQEYLKYGIYGEGKNYYYESQLAHIFLDIRKEGSFYYLEVNPQGTVNVKVSRDENGSIESVSYMTQAEVEELFGDMEEADEEYIDEECMDEEYADEVKIADEDQFTGSMGGADVFKAFDALKSLDAFTSLDALKNLDALKSLDTLKSLDVFKNLQAFNAFDEYADAYQFFDSMEDAGQYEASKYDTPQIITVNEHSIAAGEKRWFGDYDLRSGDTIRYDIEAETGSAFMIGFVNNETSGFPNVTYHSVLLHREDGVLRCTADFIRDTSIKDGNYKLYIYAPEDTLGNVKGTVSIAHAKS